MVPSTWTSQSPCPGLAKVKPRKLSILFDRLVHVPLGSLTDRSRSLTKLVEAEGVDLGSVHDRAMVKSAAALGTLNDHPLSSPVETVSPSTQLASLADHISTNPHPSWLLGAVSPAPFVELPYCPAMS